MARARGVTTRNTMTFSSSCLSSPGWYLPFTMNKTSRRLPSIITKFFQILSGLDLLPTDFQICIPSHPPWNFLQAHRNPRAIHPQCSYQNRSSISPYCSPCVRCPFSDSCAICGRFGAFLDSSGVAFHSCVRTETLRLSTSADSWLPLVFRISELHSTQFGLSCKGCQAVVEASSEQVLSCAQHSLKICFSTISLSARKLNVCGLNIKAPDGRSVANANNCVEINIELIHS